MKNKSTFSELNEVIALSGLQDRGPSQGSMDAQSEIQLWAKRKGYDPKNMSLDDVREFLEELLHETMNDSMEPNSERLN